MVDAVGDHSELPLQFGGSLTLPVVVNLFFTSTDRPEVQVRVAIDCLQLRSTATMLNSTGRDRPFARLLQCVCTIIRFRSQRCVVSCWQLGQWRLPHFELPNVKSRRHGPSCRNFECATAKFCVVLATAQRSEPTTLLVFAGRLAVVSEMKIDQRSDEESLATSVAKRPLPEDVLRRT